MATFSAIYSRAIVCSCGSNYVLYFCDCIVSVGHKICSTRASNSITNLSRIKCLPFYLVTYQTCFGFGLTLASIGVSCTYMLMINCNDSHQSCFMLV